MYTFGQFNTYFLLTNMIVLPLASLLVPCGLAGIALGGSVLGVWVGKAAWCLAWLMNHAVGWIESLPWSTIPVSISAWMVGIYYVLWAALLAVIRK
jgi:competence protein ComEC